MSPDAALLRRARFTELYLLGYGVACGAWMTGSAVWHQVAGVLVFGVMTLFSGWSWWYVRLSRRQVEREQRLDGLRRLSEEDWR